MEIEFKKKPPNWWVYNKSKGEKGRRPIQKFNREGEAAAFIKSQSPPKRKEVKSDG